MVAGAYPVLIGSKRKADWACEFSTGCALVPEN